MRRPRRQEACDDSIDPSTKEWGSLATDVRDSRGCLAGCRERFAADVQGRSVSRRAPSAETAEALCAALVAQAEKRTEGSTGYDVFNRLYCCDSVVCGHYQYVRRIRVPYPPRSRPAQKRLYLPGLLRLPPGRKKACPKNSVGIAGFDSPHLRHGSAPPSSEPAPTTDRPSILLAPTTTGASLPSSTITNVAFDFPSGDDLMAPVPQQSGLTSGVKATIAVTSIVGSLALLSLILPIAAAAAAAGTATPAAFVSVWPQPPILVSVKIQARGRGGHDHEPFLVRQLAHARRIVVDPARLDSDDAATVDDSGGRHQRHG
ncbi:unnamed protein product [Parascedosporium putredinis]|uniref:Uncharacterized protein n=1 Tax=Parascedosporium putredinis TaxID=1442378 RepID=A0A9P1M8U6_9PEZI|nr:unnamed protein product [Parascedosporium putredinis]CAI7990614.1 unnamed protein product [Parascedosporium putredinis]